ncbi:hypothetical protein [Streptomyces sp. TS71-3]|uniref:hypothetical protein n=1 Tax=Streptomyces sp. TS71-3 TaxID=2733862 RepID=UPI001B128D7E|nr:hypothetical protein [Streptomyces sp. TS71-3]GHJ34992.1 hypothetical protein Sm713_06010 [Streptomyces sp. TS71-3]
MSATEREGRPQAPAAGAGRVSMRELLASCAAARAVSTPPWSPSPPATPARGGPAAPGTPADTAHLAGPSDPSGLPEAVTSTVHPGDDGTRGAAA